MSRDADHILFYDPVCPLCVRAVERLRRLGLLERVAARPLDDDLALGLSPAERDGIRSEMLLSSLARGESFRGFDALHRLLEIHGRWVLFRRLTATAPLRGLARAAYKLVALNRRILSPPATGGVACACDPPLRPAWRAALAIVLLAAAAAGAFVFGLSLGAGAPGGSAALFGLRVLGAAGAGTAAAFAAAAATRPRRAGAILWQCLVVLAIGAVLAVPGAAVTGIIAALGASPPTCRLWSLVAAGVITAVMFLSVRRRLRNLGFPRWTPWWWLGGFVAGAGALACLV